ncbi:MULTISPECIES: helix-turn-helix domain-containing protein [unclassified Sphingobium]|uniref:helix-turn-helix domain-containing protein n=1 Tax=unclassified Sphingobium TaxID=2611147 RepID=UPI001919812A|nr:MULTISPECIES: helix-turn-helix transcriptional regulator [unclassified Sphingobium]CAD7336100.1 hypothetical protein SPHS6_00841 [Sphingobium sp. S6]CAD7336165.1 hypothetical protein SPHS8_00882 [Sphingobium sp. S8]
MMCDAPELWNYGAKIQQKCAKVKRKLFNLEEMTKRLRSERKARGLNQADFGALGGVGLQTQSRYEKGETEPSAAYFAQLAEAGVDISFVLTGERSAESLPPDIASVAALLARMTPEARASVVRLIETIAERPPFPPGQYRSYV